MDETRETRAPEPSQKTLSRREFLKKLGAVAAGATLTRVLSRAAPPQQSPTPIAEAPVKTKEAEPTGSAVPLLVDFTPLSEDRDRYKYTLTEGTPTFDFPSFFQRLTGLNYQELELGYQKENMTTFPLTHSEGLKWLHKNGYDKAIVCFALARGWSNHGANLAEAMMLYRDARNKEAWKNAKRKYFIDGKEVNEKEYMDGMMQDAFRTTPEHQYTRSGEPVTHGIKALEILPLQDFIASLEKGETQDEWGNPYYYLTVDYQQLAEALKNRPDRVINCSFNFGRVPIRIGYALPPGEVEKKSAGWIKGSGLTQGTKDGLEQYYPPAVAVETAYNEPESLEALRTFAELLPNKIVVTAAGNSMTNLPETFQAPENLILVAAWNSAEDENKPEHDFLGRPGQVYYLDPSGGTGQNCYSSQATAITSEWLSEQDDRGRWQNPAQARQLLDKHSKLQFDTNYQVLDFAPTPQY